MKKLSKNDKCIIFNNLTEFELNYFRPLIIEKFNNFQKLQNLSN